MSRLLHFTFGALCGAVASLVAAYLDYAAHVPRPLRGRR